MAQLMARLEKVFGLSALMLLATMAAAQAPPDFSGRWTAVPEPPAAGGGRGTAAAPVTMGSGWGGEITITQDRLHAHRGTRAVLPVRHAAADAHSPTGWTAPRAATPSTWAGGRRSSPRRPHCQDASVVITTTFRFSHPESGRAETIEVRQVLSLDLSGSLVITTTRSGFAGGPPSTSTTTYKRI